MELQELEVQASEKELAENFLKSKGFTIETSFVGERWWSKEVWKITWYADVFNSYIGEVLDHLMSEKRKRRKKWISRKF